MIDRLVDAGAPVDRCCKVLGTSRQNYYKHKRTPTTARQLRRQWLTGLIREIHVASRGTYGYRRVHAELTLGMGITVCPRTVSVLMTLAGIYGLPGPVRVNTAPQSNTNYPSPTTPSPPSVSHNEWNPTGTSGHLSWLAREGGLEGCCCAQALPQRVS